MQHSVHSIPHNRHKRAALGAAVLVLGIAALAPTGCDPVAPPGAQTKPFDGQALTLNCPDASFADAITPMAKAWAARTGATVTVTRTPTSATDAADVVVIPTGELGKWAEDGALAPVPAKVRSSEQLQWQGLLPIYGERLCAWGGQVLAVPLTGDGHVLVYDEKRFAEPTARAAFQQRYNRPLVAPATWDDVTDVATVFAELDKRPSLPPLPADADKLFDLFARIAASADRRALNDVELAARIARDPDSLAFQFSVVSGKPRVQSPGFQRAAQWLDRVRPLCAPPGDPVAVLTAPNGPVLALVSLDQLARLGRDKAAPGRFAIAPVPGALTDFDPDGQKLVTSKQLNYVPYFAGGRLGVVRARCPHQEAAFDLLSDLGGPARGAELVGTPDLGAGPLRGSHLNSERLLLWLGYGFDGKRSEQLRQALDQYVRQSVKNPTVGPRGPDRAAVVGEVAKPLGLLTAGKSSPAAALKLAEDAWNALDAKTHADALLRWRQRGAGLN